MTKKNIFDCKFLLIIALILMLLFPFTMSFRVSHADTPTYSNVLDDLQSDEHFNAEDFPVNETDYSLKVIQIAESTGKELFVYVYQPSGDKKSLLATTLRMSTTDSIIDEDFNPHDYKLSLLNSNGVFFKYKVDDFIVKEADVRYYDLTAIHRKFDETIDDELENNKIDEVVFEIGQLWTATTENGTVSYAMREIETISIISKYVGLVRYYSGYGGLARDFTDSHYLAFDTDKEIDKLLEVDVSFTTQDYITEYRTLKTTYSPESDLQEVRLVDSDKFNTDVTGLFGKSYERSRVVTADDFKEKENLASSAKENLENKKWVLRFLETGFDQIPSGPAAYDRGTIVKSVTVLRLQFETDKQIYNLGVSDNKQTGSGIPDNNPELPEWVKAIIALLIVILIAVVAIPLLPAIVNFVVWLIKAIWVAIKYIAKGIWWLITLPLEIFKKE